MKTKIDLTLEKKFMHARSHMIGEIINNVKRQYPDDKGLLSGVIDLTIELKNEGMTESSIEFIADMTGFILWAGSTNQKIGLVVTTMVHDLGEFARNRSEKWFCPRTHGYRKYLSGASGVSDLTEMIVPAK